MNRKPFRSAVQLLAILGGVSGAVCPHAWASTDSFNTTGPGDAIETSTTNEEDSSSPIVLNYTNVLYGPSLKNPSSYQPQTDGNPDLSRPVYMKNFLSATYGINENWAITGTGYWLYRPVLGQQLILQDPFVRLSDASVFRTKWGMNLYSDARVHFGVTSESRSADFYTGLQNFNYLSYQPDEGRFVFGLRASARYNFFGRRGSGNDTEFYLAPEANFRMAPKWALTLLYEMGASHLYGDPNDRVGNDGTDLQPGIEWDPTPDIVVNPYVTMLTGGKVNLSSTSVGMFFTWSFL